MSQSGTRLRWAVRVHMREGWTKLRNAEEADLSTLRVRGYDLTEEGFALVGDTSHAGRVGLWLPPSERDPFRESVGALAEGEVLVIEGRDELWRQQCFQVPLGTHDLERIRPLLEPDPEPEGQAETEA